MKKTIWICNHHAGLDGHRHFELAKQFVKNADIKVIVIASSFLHGPRTYLNDQEFFIQNIEKNIKYVWLRTSPPYMDNGGKRILNMFSYVRKVKKYYNQIENIYGRPDFVIGSSVHPLAWEAAYWISKKADSKFICEVRDLWPLSFIELCGMSPANIIVYFFGLIEKRAYDRSDKIITTMPYAYQYICNQYKISRKKIEWIPNGINTDIIDKALADEELNLPEDMNQYLEENWCAVYAGSLVAAECVQFILQSAEMVFEKEPEIKFAIIGDGHEKERLLEYCKKHRIENVRFFSKITKEQVALALKKGKICLAAHENVSLYKYGLSMNKLNDYLYSGRPVVFACDAENVVKDSGGGITMEYGKEEKYADAILRLYKMSEKEKNHMGKRGKEEIEKKYSFNVLGPKYRKILEDIESENMSFD